MQIDLLIDRADKAINICEMKYAATEYEISVQEHDKLLNRRNAYVKDMKFKGSVFLTLVTPHGVRRNAYWNDIQSEVTLDDLF